jgi:hypothetical protein
MRDVGFITRPSTNPPMIARLILMMAFTATLGGCSLVFTSGPPPPAERGAAFSCTTSYVAPILDLAWVTYALAATAAEKTGGIGTEDIALGAVWGGSAAYGIWNATRCRAAIEEADQRLGTPAELERRSRAGPLGPVAIPTWPSWTLPIGR